MPTSVLEGSVAKAFDAKLSLAEGSVGLCFIAAHKSSPRQALASINARIVATLDHNKVLAITRLEDMALLQSHPDIAIAGPVTIDRERFARFAELVNITR